MLIHSSGYQNVQNLNIDKFRSRLHVVDVLEHCLKASQVQDLPAASDIVYYIQSRMEELTHEPASSAAETAVICTDLSGMSALVQDSCAQMVTVFRHLISLVRSAFSFRHKQALSMYCCVRCGSRSSTKKRSSLFNEMQSSTLQRFADAGYQLTEGVCLDTGSERRHHGARVVEVLCRRGSRYCHLPAPASCWAAVRAQRGGGNTQAKPVGPSSWCSCLRSCREHRSRTESVCTSHRARHKLPVLQLSWACPDAYAVHCVLRKRRRSARNEHGVIMMLSCPVLSLGNRMTSHLGSILCLCFESRCATLAKCLHFGLVTGSHFTR